MKTKLTIAGLAIVMFLDTYERTSLARGDGFDDAVIRPKMSFEVVDLEQVCTHAAIASLGA